MKEGGRACDSSSKPRGKGEEVMDSCHGTRRGAPAYIDFLSEIVQKDSPSSHSHVGMGPHVNETWCVISRAKCDLAALARGAALVIDLYFFNIQSEWIDPVVITRERIYRWARWAGGNNLSAKRVDTMLGFVWIFQL